MQLAIVIPENRNEIITNYHSDGLSGLWATHGWHKSIIIDKFSKNAILQLKHCEEALLAALLTSGFEHILHV